jgi:5-formyltetrahydrofolate cyclo-ligase
LELFMRWLKQQSRRILQEKRLKLDLSLQNALSAQIAQKLTHSLYFRQATHIAFYCAFKGEVSTTLILKAAQQLGKSCYLPVLHNNQLAFIQCEPNDVLKPNHFGILEPLFDLKKQISPRKLDLVLLPLVAFDREGNRLGMGKGYYDKTFAFRQKTLKPQLVGLAYDFQRINRVPNGELDVKLDGIVTEKQIYIAPRSRA